MSDRSGASRVILSGLAVGAILGTPSAAAAAEPPAAGTESIAAVSSSRAGDEATTTAAAIREQFQASYTAGAVQLPTDDPIPIICATA